MQEYLPKLPHASTVQELNMRMGYAQGVEAFVPNMQHAQVWCLRERIVVQRKQKKGQQTGRRNKFPRAYAWRVMFADLSSSMIFHTFC